MAKSANKDLEKELIETPEDVPVYDASKEEDLEEQFPVEDKEPEEKVIQIPVIRPKQKAKVFRVRENSLILIDEKGNGIKIDRVKRHKDVQLGDVISF